MKSANDSEVPIGFEHRIGVSRETVAPLSTYAALLVKWQKAKNLVASATLDDMWTRHFLDSAQLAPFFKRDSDTKPTLLDIGSGAGFPGLVLGSMALADVHMVESNGRKCSFMAQVSRSTDAGAVIHNSRIEDLDPFPVDYVTSRACARLTQLLEWAAPFCSPATTLLFLKGEQAQEELTEARASWNMTVITRDSLTDTAGQILQITALERR